MTAPVSPCVVGMLLAVSMDTRRTKTAVCGGNAGDFAVDRAFRPGWIVKQEKTGWVAIAPTRHFTAAGNAGCMAVLRGVLRFHNDGQTAFLWVGCDLPILEWVGCNLCKMPDLPTFVGCSNFHK